MRSNSKAVLALAFAAALAGCNMQYPTSYSGAGGGRTIVADFVSTLNVNSNLAEAGTSGSGAPNYLVTNPGAANGYGPNGFTLGLSAPGVSGSSQCAHIYGTVTDPGNGSYPAMLLQVFLHAGASTAFDASFFSGVKFYFKTDGTDNAGTRSFSIPTDGTNPSPQGTCSTNCYDHFGVNLSATGGNWQVISLDFTSLVRAGWGSPVSPAALVGDNLKRFRMLQWQEGNNNVAATITTDFYVVEIQFY